MNIANARNATHAIEQILSAGPVSTQSELREQLIAAGFEVTQSTVSRALRKLGAVRVHEDGRSVYRLQGRDALPPVNASLVDLVTDVTDNGQMIVIHTKPGSASLIARHIDHYADEVVLGTIAGDDTIFCVPATGGGAAAAAKFLRHLLSPGEQ